MAAAAAVDVGAQVAVGVAARAYHGREARRAAQLRGRVPARLQRRYHLLGNNPDSFRVRLFNLIIIIIISLLTSPLLGHRPSLWITHKGNGA
jgi:hypothetical protein